MRRRIDATIKDHRQPMKRSGWTPGEARTSNSSQKKVRGKSVNDILRASYRLYARDKASQKAVKHCIG